MKTMKRILIILFLAVVFPVSVLSLSDYILNGDFSEGLNYWAQIGYGRGVRLVNVIYDDDINSSVMEYIRAESGNDGGYVGLSQPLNINVNECSEIYLEADVKVISNTLPDSGWWSWVYGGVGEFPGMLAVDYKDADGNNWAWAYGFLPTEDARGRTNYDIVIRNQWYHFISPNLVYVKTTVTKPGNVPIDSPSPSLITGISVGGSGWDFSGRFDNIKITCIPKVAIDIKPESFPNSINIKSKGEIPVAILSSPEFDAPGLIDTTSLTFGRTGNESSLAFCNKSPEDVNDDGLPDLICHFYTQMTGFQAGDGQGFLKGRTINNLPIGGVDSVRIVETR